MICITLSGLLTSERGAQKLLYYPIDEQQLRI